LNANGATYYKWSPANGTINNPNISNPIATPTDSVTTYTVYGMTEFGCLDSAHIKVYVDQDVKDFAPSGFTPNGDGKNDVFRLIGMRFHKLVDFRIYNRWGEKVFQTSNIEDGWDGSYKGVPQDLGTYMYEIIVALPNGLNKSYKGNVTLIR
jgi:gliding motility-associated-like protein